MNSRDPVRVQKKTGKAGPTLTERRSYSKPILQSQLDLLREGTFSDVTFIVGPSKERIPCHQLFLKARSPFFEVMFSERWDHDHDKSKEVPLDDVDPLIFRKFLEFMYSDTFVANVSEALELLQVAHMYDVQLLVDKCEQLLESEVTLDDAVDVFQAARKYDKIQLMHKVGDFMAKSLSKLQSQPSFSRLDKQTLIFLLKRDDLRMKEVDVFRLAMQWGKSQSGSTVKHSLEGILPLIRFPIMTLTEFTTAVVPTGILPQSTLIKIFTYFGTDTKTKKSLASSLKFSTQQRKSENSIVSFALYPGDLEGESRGSRKLGTLKECLGFSVHYDDCLQTQPFSVHYDDCYQIQPLMAESPTELMALLKPSSAIDGDDGIGLNGISFYCPARTEGYGVASCSFKEFQIRVTARLTAYAGQPFQELFSLSPVKAEEGEIMEIAFDTAVPLENHMHYCISVEEIKTASSQQGFASSQYYEVKNFGYQQPSATVKVGDTRLSLQGIQRNNTDDGFWSEGYTQPQLILKLSLKEL